jgi:hypothetical protein
MTEDEAKTKWCPMVRTGLTAGMAVNHHVSGDVDEQTRCKASECMMWRWEQHYIRNSITFTETNGTVTSDWPKPTDGYCGLASA